MRENENLVWQDRKRTFFGTAVVVHTIPAGTG